jgi:hypothetical protein
MKWKNNTKKERNIEYKKYKKKFPHSEFVHQRVNISLVGLLFESSGRDRNKNKTVKSK